VNSNPDAWVQNGVHKNADKSWNDPSMELSRQVWCSANFFRLHSCDDDFTGNADIRSIWTIRVSDTFVCVRATHSI
jgi:hypothetical protein